jgi:hypothetical protein
MIYLYDPTFFGGALNENNNVYIIFQNQSNYFSEVVNKKTKQKGLKKQFFNNLKKFLLVTTRFQK